MKRINYMLLSALMLSILASCDNFMDVHQEYNKGGEIIYAPKIDSMVFIAGRNRIQFRYWLYKSPNVRSVDLYWNDGIDSLIIPVTPSAGIDSFYTMIPNLEEKSYTFRARTTDAHGHKSLYTTTFGTSYGDIYESSLNGRRINEVTLTDGDQLNGNISLLPISAEGLVLTEVRYETTDGTTEIASAVRSVSSIVCPSARAGSFFEVRSLFIPEAESVDTFATAWTIYQTPFPSIFQYDRSSWEVVESSDSREDASGNMGMRFILDGNMNTYWQSYYMSEETPGQLPHWVIVDMKIPRNIVKFDIYRRNDVNDTKTVDCYLGDTPDVSGTWIKIGEGEFPETIGPTLLEIETTDKVFKGRYLKLVMPDSWREPYTNIVELYPYGGN